ncbi:uroporphyrinogen decarboxylase [Corynebacterium mendelii]|uniref:Uroporphyrinogen decarboxylase n=1 Tax=Corynebacterium mendelii TaxID=2765362 RepID=A0A939DZ27_9CORY|nr:uroporphyrinogen decarboxylase [Corynebacterium mendelii]MBN9643885.1 uroporphyrinogen decarboxylase [Corynebacterium mendelii]
MTSPRRTIPDAPLIAAATGSVPSRQPVWFMRQAGRSLPEYRKAREGIGMLDACFRPDLLADITCQPVRRHDVDAAILFSDIVVPLKAAGVDVDIVPGRGPVMGKAVTTKSDVDNLPVLDHEVSHVAEGIGIILEELQPAQALIGFVGAPFTLASYLVEGGPSKNHCATKALMHAEPEIWHALMRKITDTVIRFLRTQVDAGIDCMQLFDSWAGYLTAADYRRHVLPYSAEILATVDGVIPRIHFGVTTGELLAPMSTAGAEVMGVDWRVPLDQAARRIFDASGAKVLQGNLDPAMLFAGEQVMEEEIGRIHREAASAMANGTASGHIFNLGHGVLPDTDPDAVTRAVELIHEL